MTSASTPPASSGAKRLGPRGWVAMSGVVLATLGTTLPQSMSAPVIEVTARAYGTTVAESSWALTIVLVVAVATSPLIGRLGDAYGAHRMLMILLPVVAAGLLIAALAPTIGWLLAGRALQGLGGGAFPLTIAIVPHIVPVHRRAAAVGLVSAMSATGIAFGVLVAGVLADHIGIRALSWVPLTVVAIAEALVIASIPRIPARRDVHLDVPAAVALAAGVVLLLLAVTEAPRLPLPALWIVLCLAGGLGALAFWLRRERRSPDPLIGARQLRRRAVWAVHMTALLLGATLLGTFVLIPAFAEAPLTALTASGRGSGLGATVTQAGFLLLPATVAMLTVGPLSGILRRWAGTRAPILLGAAVAASGALVLLASTRQLTSVVLATVLLGVGIATASAGMINVLVDVVEPDQVGVTTGVNVVARQLGGAIGAALVAVMLVGGAERSTAAAFTSAFVTVAILAALAVTAALLIPSSRRSGADGPDASTRVSS